MRVEAPALDRSHKRGCALGLWSMSTTKANRHGESIAIIGSGIFQVIVALKTSIKRFQSKNRLAHLLSQWLIYKLQTNILLVLYCEQSET